MKPIVIAGNGPSLAQIDYARLPQEFDLFRCNQFYLEDRYFLGKKIKGVFFNPSVFKEQFFTLHHLKERGEYEVEDVYCNIVMGIWDREWSNGKPKNLEQELEYDFPSVKSVYPYLKKMQDFNALLKFHALYYKQRFTAGIIMLITALAQGYQEIYLTGIDFYEEGGTSYAFETKGSKRINEKLPMFNQENFRDLVHLENIDLEAIKLALSLPHIRIYCLSQKSPLAKLVPLAPLCTQTPMQVLSKPDGYINDWIPLPEMASQSSCATKNKLASLRIKLGNFLLGNKNRG